MSNIVGESYTGGNGKTYISPAQIRKMKRNMKKVPRIQTKAQQYSEKEGKIADQRFDQHLKDIDTI